MNVREVRLMTAKILVVDDDKLLREIVADFLRKNGYEVDMAESAAKALEIFEPGCYDLCLLDLVMPGKNGLELMAELFERDSDIFCLIMTGYPTVDNAYKSMVEGASDYIIKPFEFKELLKSVRQHLEK